MTWLQPWAAWFAAGVPVIVLLYFLRLKRRPVTVSTLMFWQRALQESSRRAFFQRLRNLLSLLLHLLIFLLLVGALARPVLDRFVREGSSTVLVLDIRARMQAVEPDGGTRFESALQLAKDYARQAGGRREFALVTLDAKPSVAVPFTGDERPLLKALDEVLVTDAAGELSPALDLANSLLAARKGTKRIVLLTDRAAASGKPGAIPLVTHAVGSSLDNLAITRFATRPMSASPETGEVLLEVQNFGAAPARTDVELAFDGRPIEVKPLALAPGERRLEIFTSVPRPARSARGWLTAKLSASDALAIDNIAFATLPPARTDRVLLVSKGNTFLEKLLGVDSGIKFQFITPEACQPAMAEKFEVVIFDGSLPEGFDLKTARGNFLFLKTTPFSEGGAPVEQPLVTDVDASHPAMRLVSLQNVTVIQAQSLILPPPHDGWTFAAPIRSFEHPLLITGERGSQRAAALAFDVLQSDLPLRVAFPLLMSSTLHWLAGERADSLPSLAAGEIFPLRPGQSVAPAPLTALPKPGDKIPPPSIAGFFEPVRNGFYQVNEAGATRWLAVNTSSATESNLRTPLANDPSSAAILPPTIGLRGWPLWQWLALAAFALISTEWWLFHRRKTE
jgi:hypothetical protein